MPINTLDAAVAGMRPPVRFAKVATAALVAGRPTSLWALGGAPGAGSNDATLNGVVLSSSAAQVAGQLPHFNPTVGNAHLARLSGSATQPGVLSLFDRLWHNGGINVTLTTAQAIVSPAWPARCPLTGLDDTPSSNGYGVMLALVVSANTGAGAPVVTVGYTNDQGVAGRTATNVLPTAASAPNGVLYFIGLQAGDTGVRSVQSITLSATWTSGTVNLVALRTLADLELPLAGVPNAVDVLTSGKPRLYDGAVPYLVFTPSTGTATNVSGTYVETQG